MRCLFCAMHQATLPEGNHTFVPEDICDAHKSITGIPEYLVAHPNGQHTDTCGCKTLNLTYLARGIIKEV